jgi:hypothetical protein
MQALRTLSEYVPSSMIVVVEVFEIGIDLFELVIQNLDSSFPVPPRTVTGDNLNSVLDSYSSQGYRIEYPCLA